MEQILEQILDELRAQNRNARLWTTEDIARYFSLSRASIYSRVICRPDFPRPIKIEGVGKRWKPDEVKAYADRAKQSA